MLEMIANCSNTEKDYIDCFEDEDIPYIRLWCWIKANEKMHEYVEVDEAIELVNNNLNFVAKQIVEGGG